MTADNAKESLALYKRELAWLINDGFANGDNGARVVELAELNGFLDPVKERLIREFFKPGPKGK